ncbi:MAG: hypothetical protein ACTHL8_26385 [Burkholderiaceae bacterium]
MSRRPALPLVVAGALAFCTQPASPQSAGDGWARFDEPSALSAARPIAASEVPGDAAVSPLRLDGGLLTVEGIFGLDNGSRWSTLGAEIAPTGARAGADMGGASVLRIRLAAADARPLRVRIKGGDRDIANAGCYPVVLQVATAVPTDYVIPLSAFRAPGWCGRKAASIEQTLHAVERVEVTANDGPAGPVRFSAGRIDFLPDDWNAPDDTWHLAWQDDFDGERDRPPAGTAWQADGATGRDVALDGAGHLRLHLRPAGPAAGGRLSIRSAADRPITQGRVEVRLRTPEGGAGVRVALEASSAGAPSLVLLERSAGADGFAAGLETSGAGEATSRSRTAVARPLGGHFVTLACEREPGRVRWLVDGAVVLEATRDDLAPAAWAALDGAPLALAITVDGEGAADGRSDLLVDRVGYWQRQTTAAANAPAASRASMRPGPAAPAVAQAPAPARRRPAVAPSAAPSATAPAHRVVCEHSARYDLMLCY